mmetsp:Transcript_6159/g.13630  ORF Transcript_6159/g.13630 Transcript_6159/m.13630 type:complete len:355 (+) Transcript_6159:383-1447(+)
MPRLRHPGDRAGGAVARRAGRWDAAALGQQRPRVDRKDFLEELSNDRHLLESAAHFCALQADRVRRRPVVVLLGVLMLAYLGCHQLERGGDQLAVFVALLEHDHMQQLRDGDAVRPAVRLVHVEEGIHLVFHGVAAGDHEDADEVAIVDLPVVFEGEVVEQALLQDDVAHAMPTEHQLEGASADDPPVAPRGLREDRIESAQPLAREVGRLLHVFEQLPPVLLPQPHVKVSLGVLVDDGVGASVFEPPLAEGVDRHAEVVDPPAAPRAGLGGERAPPLEDVKLAAHPAMALEGKALLVNDARRSGAARVLPPRRGDRGARVLDRLEEGAVQRLEERHERLALEESGGGGAGRGS